MRKAKQIAGGMVLGAGLMITGAVTSATAHAAPAMEHFDDPHGMTSRLRDLIDRTQADLRQAADLDHPKGDSRERYHDAQGHLSTFDRHLVKGKFDKSELDRSIGKIKEILDKNILQASSRDALHRDLAELRFVRDGRE